jgi:hypothetical protein
LRCLLRPRQRTKDTKQDSNRKCQAHDRVSIQFRRGKPGG